MSKKLVTVTVTYDYVIVVDDHEDTYKVARRYARNALHDMDPYDLEINVTPGVHASGWDDRCIPYNSDDDKTTGEYK